MATLTEFGKCVRKMRIDREMTLMDMANKLEVTPAFLSSVETGRKPIPSNMVGRMAAVLELPESKIRELESAASKSKPEVRIQPHDSFEAEVALMFARRMADRTVDLEAVHALMIQGSKEEGPI